MGTVLAMKPADAGTGVPREVKVLSEWSWRLLLIVAAGTLVVLAVRRLEVIAVALFAALFLTALLAPVQGFLSKRVPRGLATAGSMVTLLVVAGGLVGFVSNRVASDWDELRMRVGAGLDDVQEWLRSGPLHLTDQQLDQWLTSGREALGANQGTLTTGALGAAGTAGEVLTGFALAMFATIFFLHDGGRIWRWCQGLIPGRDHVGSDAAGAAAWRTLTGYVRGTVTIAFADAVLICTGLLIVGVPLAVPLSVAVFIGAFIPIVGSLAAGVLAAAVALATGGVTSMLVVIAIIVGVQQLEGHVLQPLIMSKAVSIHPLGTILAVAAGTILAGIVGAVVSVPIAAVLNNSLAAWKEARKGGSPVEALEALEDDDSPPASGAAPGAVPPALGPKSAEVAEVTGSAATAVPGPAAPLAGEEAKSRSSSRSRRRRRR
jgi:predicted PurR-regulated permease PerM